MDNGIGLKLETADAFFSTGTCVGGACGATSVSFTYTATGRRKSMTVPFASSYQGGHGASVMGVPGREQNIQDGIIAASYSLEQIGIGDDYFVVVF